LEGVPLSLWQTNIYPKLIFDKLCSWLSVLVDEIYPWSVRPPYETHWGVAGGFTERAIGLFNAMEYKLSSTNLNPLHLYHEAMCEKGQYNHQYFLNQYEPDVYTKIISDKVIDESNSYSSLTPYLDTWTVQLNCSPSSVRIDFYDKATEQKIYTSRDLLFIDLNKTSNDYRILSFVHSQSPEIRLTPDANKYLVRIYTNNVVITYLVTIQIPCCLLGSPS
jgi:hypothetical protein